MKILAIDTATEACSAALYFDGEINQQYRVAPREHSHIILPMIDQLLAEAGIRVSDLDALAFGRGPGSFMGVRIAAGVTQGIAFAWDLPVVPISTLAAIAQTAHAETGATSVLSAIDARMNEVYWGAYRLSDDGCMELTGKEIVILPEQVNCPGEHDWCGAGSGWASSSRACVSSPSTRATSALCAGVGFAVSPTSRSWTPSSRACAVAGRRRTSRSWATHASPAWPKRPAS